MKGGVRFLHRAHKSPILASTLLSSLFPASTSSLPLLFLPLLLLQSLPHHWPLHSAFKHVPALTSLKKAFPLMPLPPFCCQTFILWFRHFCSYPLLSSIPEIQLQGPQLPALPFLWSPVSWPLVRHWPHLCAASSPPSAPPLLVPLLFLPCAFLTVLSFALLSSF